MIEVDREKGLVYGINETQKELEEVQLTHKEKFSSLSLPLITLLNSQLREHKLCKSIFY